MEKRPRFKELPPNNGEFKHGQEIVQSKINEQNFFYQDIYRWDADKQKWCFVRNATWSD